MAAIAAITTIATAYFAYKTKALGRKLNGKSQATESKSTEENKPTGV